jgi:hypothetical protein
MNQLENLKLINFIVFFTSVSFCVESYLGRKYLNGSNVSIKRTILRISVEMLKTIFKKYLGWNTVKYTVQDLFSCTLPISVFY